MTPRKPTAKVKRSEVETIEAFRDACVKACEKAGLEDAENIPHVLGIVQLATNDCIAAICSIDVDEFLRALRVKP